jgi:hypothetical protein
VRVQRETDCGADDYGARLFDIGEIRQRIENHLAARRHLQARYRDEVEIGPTGVEEETRSFVEELIGVIDEHLSNSDLTVGQFTDEMALGRRHLTPRLQNEVDMTPGLPLLPGVSGGGGGVSVDLPRPARGYALRVPRTTCPKTDKNVYFSTLSPRKIPRQPRRVTMRKGFVLLTTGFGL